MRETIYALASGAGQAGVAVFRISGLLAGEILATLSQKPTPAPRKAVLRQIVDPEGGDVLDQALVLWFPGPASFTGEDVAEIHTHGSPALITALARACQTLGARQAFPGEFTRRAYENGKLDLLQAEGLADLIEAETEAQRRQAVRQMEGALSTVYQDWREALKTCLVSLESSLDFPDEEDIPHNLHDRARPILLHLLEDMQKHLEEGKRGRSLRDGIRVTLIGAPNAGKSTLLNALTRREAALVSPMPGTTRDVIEVRLVVQGILVLLADTAGLRESEELIEKEGIRRALHHAEAADIRLALVDGTCLETDVLRHLQEGDILLLNKSDQEWEQNPHQKLKNLRKDIHCLSLSALTGEGMEEFEDVLGKTVQARFALSEQPGLTRLRHAEAIKRAHSALERARHVLMQAPELAGEDVRLALRALEELIGHVGVEDILDRVFSQFCIGK